MLSRSVAEAGPEKVVVPHIMVELTKNSGCRPLVPGAVSTLTGTPISQFRMRMKPVAMRTSNEQSCWKQVFSIVTWPS